MLRFAKAMIPSPFVGEGEPSEGEGYGTAMRGRREFDLRAAKKPLSLALSHAKNCSCISSISTIHGGRKGRGNPDQWRTGGALISLALSHNGRGSEKRV